ncbi:M24 family metallopeptidase [Piscinibacter sakaiensis]
MTIESQADIEGLRRVGAVVSRTLQALLAAAEPGMRTRELDALGARMLAEAGARSAPQLSYGFPGATCISLNEEAAHGVPGDRMIAAGDVLNVDVSAELDGYFADTGGSRVIPPQQAQHARLLHATRCALEAAMAAAEPHRPRDRTHRARPWLPRDREPGQPRHGPGAARGAGRDPRHLRPHRHARAARRAGDHDRALPVDALAPRPRRRRRLDPGRRTGQPLGAVRAHDDHHARRADRRHPALMPDRGSDR